MIGAHEFVVAPFPVKKDGIMGLDLLTVLRANIDVAAGEITLDGQKIRLANHPLGGRKENHISKILFRYLQKNSQFTAWSHAVIITTYATTHVAKRKTDVILSSGDACSQNAANTASYLD